jgi:predicted HTH transcriptional regulator
MREHGTQADVEYELPRAAVIEAIVNAIAHRDYSNNASVQIMLFSDRLEIWNPGELLPPLTMEQLRKSHPSVPRNPRIAEPMFLARYIEKAGTGTLDMIAQFRDAKLPEPEFRQEGGMFVQTLWRDWLTSDVLNSLNLNDRQIKGILEVKSKGKIGNSAYQALTEATKKTATRDLEDLTEKAILVRVGNGRGTHYILNLKRDIKETKETFSNTTIENNNGDIKGTKGT